MKKIILSVVFLALAVSAGAGTKEDMEQLQRNVLDLQQQFWDLENNLKSGNSALQTTVQKFQQTTQELQENQASLNAKLESILNQVQALNEKLDETNQRIRDLSSQRTLVPPQNNDNPQPSGQTG